MYEIIHVNNELMPASRWIFPPNDRGLLYGDGIFETVRVEAGSPRLLRKHWERLTNGASILGINYTQTCALLNQAIVALLNANDLTDKNAIVRITLTRGQGPREIFPSLNLDPSLLIIAFPLYQSEKNELTACVSTIRRNETSPLSKIKSLNYLDNILARREAMKAGVDEAILLNTRGNVAEASTANLFIVKNNTLFTPSISEGALPGIIRQAILDIATTLNFPKYESELSIDDLYNADEVFITNSVINIKTLIAIDTKKLKTPSASSITNTIKQHLGIYFNKN